MDRPALRNLLDEEIGRKANMAILMFSTAVSDRLGLNLTDMFCGELLSRTGPLTAGELANLTGLTTGAITGVIDRLEKNGYTRDTKMTHMTAAEFSYSSLRPMGKAGRTPVSGVESSLS